MSIAVARYAAERNWRNVEMATILLVEDDDLFRFAAKAGLETAGFRVLSSGNVKTAMTILANAAPDLLLTDVRLGGNIDGVVLSSMARAQRPVLRVLFLTGFEESIRRASDYGTVLAKPVKLDVLVAAVRRELGQSR